MARRRWKKKEKRSFPSKEAELAYRIGYMSKNFAKRCGVEPAVARELLRKLIRSNEGKPCPYCLEPLTIGTVSPDHKVPLSRGGTSGEENIEAICKDCNSTKSNMTAEEYSALWAFLRERDMVKFVIPRLKMGNLVYMFRFRRKRK